MTALVMRDEASDVSTSAQLHRDHDALAQELRGWFTNSSPQINYEVTKQWYGYVSNPEGPIGPRLILDIDDPTRIVAALLAASADCAGKVLTVWVDDRQRWAQLDETLRAAGCRPVKATTHRALVGALDAQLGPTDLLIDDVDDERIEEWAITKFKCFANSELEPTREWIDAEIATRRTEMSLTRLQLARLDGESVGVLAYYVGQHQMVFNLGTRIPFRRRGIAQAMLAQWAARGVIEGCRSLIINADDPGQPQELYRRMGFVDEVYWYQRYQFDTEQR
jgi:hypothetical protein